MGAETISAGRLNLRPFTTTDIPWVYDVSLDPTIQRFMHLPCPYAMEDAAFFVERLAIEGWEKRERAEFLVEDAATGARLGRAGLELLAAGAAEIGYWVDLRFRSRGVATEAVRAVCRWGFDALDLEVIQWSAEVGNDASRHVAEKAGFMMEATLRKRLVRQGSLKDAWVGSLLRDEASL